MIDIMHPLRWVFYAPWIYAWLFTAMTCLSKESAPEAKQPSSTSREALHKQDRFWKQDLSVLGKFSYALERINQQDHAQDVDLFIGALTRSEGHLEHHLNHVLDHVIKLSDEPDEPNYVAIEQQKAVLQMLLRRGVNVKKPYGGSSGLHKLVGWGRVKLLECVLGHYQHDDKQEGDLINFKSSGQGSLLGYAMGLYHTKKAALKKRNVHKHALKKEMHALQGMVHFLLSKKECQVDHKVAPLSPALSSLPIDLLGAEGRTSPFYFALKHGYKDWVSRMLNRPINLDACYCLTQKHPLDLAKEQGDLKVWQALKKISQKNHNRPASF